MTVFATVRAAAGVLILSPCVALLVTVAAAQDRRLPDQLDDAAFWQLVSDLSEPDGFFEDENYVSNELGYQRIMQRLQDTATPGRVFVGVGPEQNFAYLGALRPKMAFIIDIRRQNLIQHLMYKALFELSDDRADFLQRLFSRPRPPGVDADTSAEALFQAYARMAPDQRLFDETLARMLEVLTERHRFALTTNDRAALRKVFNAFFASGPQLMYVFRGTAEIHPTYVQMMTAKDEAGRNWSCLGSSQTYQHIRQMHRRNLIVPVVGDFAGPKAIRAVGKYVRDHGEAVSVFYVSNVEPYLFRAGTWRRFYDNLQAVPFTESAIFIRSFFGATARECGSLRPTIRTPVTSAVAAVLDAYRRGDLKTQCDLVAASR
jgi:hypothetical protein